jgi:hypothetical protein
LLSSSAQQFPSDPANLKINKPIIRNDEQARNLDC